MDGSHSFDGDRHIQLRRYGTDELVDILEGCANRGLAKDLVTRDQLRTIANHVAGVARLGIQSLSLRSLDTSTENRGRGSVAREVTCSRLYRRGKPRTHFLSFLSAMYSRVKILISQT